MFGGSLGPRESSVIYQGEFGDLPVTSIDVCSAPLGR